jgi:hypothetical protein
MALQLDPAQNRSQANLFIGATSQESQNSLQFGSFQFGSVDPTLPSGNVTINEIDQLIGTASALAPAVSAQGTPTSIVNNERLITQEGVFVEIQRGSQLSTALSSRVGQSFCQCEYTRWGLWNSQFTRPGPNNSTIEERAQMFWVAGRLPTAGEVPTSGSATYDDPRFFAGALSGLNNQSRAMVITGSFFNGARGPAGEMGGALQVGGSSYSGSGIFAATQR